MVVVAAVAEKRKAKRRRRRNSLCYVASFVSSRLVLLLRKLNTRNKPTSLIRHETSDTKHQTRNRDITYFVYIFSSFLGRSVFK